MGRAACRRRGRRHGWPVQSRTRSGERGFRFGAPVHFIRLGDTTLQKDVRIDRLLHNDIAGLGNRFPIEVEIGSQGVTGPARVTLTGPDTRLVETVTLEPGGAPAVTTFLVEAARPGIQRYTVQVRRSRGRNQPRQQPAGRHRGRHRAEEAHPAHRDRPHPDRGAWSNALSANANYEVVQHTVADLVDGALDEGLGTACSSSGSILATGTAGTCSRPPAKTDGPSASSWTPKPTSPPSPDWASGWTSNRPEQG